MLCQVSFHCFIWKPLSILAAYFLFHETIEQKSPLDSILFEIQKSYTVYGSWKEYKMYLDTIAHKMKSLNEGVVIQNLYALWKGALWWYHKTKYFINL